jgi:hypothetical protein
MQRCINERTPLFLLNFQTRVVFGVFQAEASPSMNIVRLAWGGSYPAQVRVKCIRKQNAGPAAAVPRVAEKQLKLGMKLKQGEVYDQRVTHALLAALGYAI